MKDRFAAFTALIAKISRHIKRIKAEEMAEFNLKISHVNCLYYLNLSGALTARQLVEVCDEDKAAVSRTVDFLERNGYVLSECPVGKRYNALITLSEKGKRIAEHITGRIESVLYDVGEWMTDEEREAFYSSLSRISLGLEKICEKYNSNTVRENSRE